MVIVEFFDKVSLENICGALLCRPDEVILVGSNRSRMERSIACYGRLLRSKGIGTRFSYIGVSRNNLQAIVDVLTKIVESCDECILDLTGGDDLYLVAVGIVMSRYSHRVQCHRFNFHKDKLYDCDADGRVLQVGSFDVSVEDNISMYGGDIITECDQPCYTYPWVFSDDFLSDVNSMWEICKADPKAWNGQTSTLGAICERIKTEPPLLVSFDRDGAQSALYESKIRYVCDTAMLCKLEGKGLISDLRIDKSIYFKFKNEQIKRCLTVAGQILELFIASRLIGLKGEDGSRLYNDVKVGTVIRWGQSDERDNSPTINEIDVIAMKGAIPVFISCKNGYFDANELYKLNTVADRFGNKYAKMALVSTDIDNLGAKSEYLLSRMEDMEIKCISHLNEISNTELDRILASLWLH